MSRWLAPALLLVLVLRLDGSDHQNLEENLPVRLEDAYPTEYRNRELQFFTRYARRKDGTDRVEYVPRLEVGFARNWQATLSSRLLSGSADRTGSGNLSFELFRNLNTEGAKLPAFAVAGGAEFPSGNDAAGVDPRLKVIVTKTLGRTSYFHRIHANFQVVHDSARSGAEERRERHTGIVGYSARAGANSLFVADYVWEQDRMQGREVQIIEAGFRTQLDPLTVVSVGVGFGVGPDSPRIRATIGIQRTLTFPYL